MMSREAIDTVVATAATRATYTGTGATIFSYLLSSEFGILVGIVLGVAGLVVNFIFRRRTDRRQQDQHEAWMKKMLNHTVPGPLEMPEADE